MYFPCFIFLLLYWGLCRTGEPSADHGVSPLRQFERIPQQAQEAHRLQAPAALRIADLQGTSVARGVDTTCSLVLGLMSSS